jgi:hypothetical protein
MSDPTPAISKAHTIWLMGYRQGIRYNPGADLDPVWEADLERLRANGGFEELLPPQ